MEEPGVADTKRGKGYCAEGLIKSLSGERERERQIERETERERAQSPMWSPAQAY